MREIALKLVKLFIVLTQANSYPMFPEQTGPLALLWGSQLSPPISGLKPRAVISPFGQMELEDAPQWIRLWFSSFLRCGIQGLQNSFEHPNQADQPSKCPGQRAPLPWFCRWPKLPRGLLLQQCRYELGLPRSMCCLLHVPLPSPSWSDSQESSPAYSPASPLMGSQSRDSHKGSPMMGGLSVPSGISFSTGETRGSGENSQCDAVPSWWKGNTVPG